MEEKFHLKDGGWVCITIDDENDFLASVKTSDGKDVGRLEFDLIEGPGVGFDVLRLRWAYLDFLGDDFKHQGIGQKCLEMVREFSGLSIVAAHIDDPDPGDGSHLTGDSLGFVEKMRERGLIEA